jgi:sugar O-acyltransferase (sialic acid O-acetyltransferase NeuD family)
MTLKKVVLLGAGGHAKSCIDVIEQTGLFEIVGLLGKFEEIGIEVSGYKVIGSDDDLPRLNKEIKYAINCIGGIGSQQLRKKVTDNAKLVGFEFPEVVSPHAMVSRNAYIGEGTMVFHGAIINSGAYVAEGCVINTNALIEHDVKIERFTHISTQVTINGNVSIGASSFLGSGSIIKEGIYIGEDCLVGMGTIVRKDISNGTKYVG